MVNISGPFSGIPKFLPDRDDARRRLRVRLMPSGGLLDWAAALQYVGDEAMERETRSALVDVSASAFIPSLAEGQALSDRLRQVRGTFSGPVALLAASDLQFGACRVIASYADATAAPVAVFREESAALRWLDDGLRHGG